MASMDAEEPDRPAGVPSGLEACRAFDGCFSMSVERSVEVDVMALAEASTLRRDSASELSFMTAI